MARTKQTAKKTTCGEAIRVVIETTALNSMAANLPMINGSTGDSCSLVPLLTRVLNGTRPCFQAMLSASLTQDVQENNNVGVIYNTIIRGWGNMMVVIYTYTLRKRSMESAGGTYRLVWVAMNGVGRTGVVSVV
ncbi:hypothetical protein BU15DRAFT_64302 [Melanogaster broomeanus]|nr:hypothetical protein BU15DRAFT_64302 [Melanogaster broomeanus]